jgi:NTE family protein
MSTFQIMQTSIVEHKLRISRPDIYIKPELKNIKALEFYRYAEIMDGVKSDVKHFKDEVSTWIKKRLPII